LERGSATCGFPTADVARPWPPCRGLIGSPAWARQALPGRAEKKHSQVTAQPQPLRAAGLRSTRSRIKPSDVAAISLPPTGPGWERKWMMLCLPAFCRSLAEPHACMSDVATGLLQPATSSKSLLSLLYYCYTDLGAVVCLRHLQMQMSVDTKRASSQKKTIARSRGPADRWACTCDYISAHFFAFWFFTCPRRQKIEHVIIVGRKSAAEYYYLGLG
jgi:hypothetical protein